MRTRTSVWSYFLLGACLLLTATLVAQTSGRITGTVVDQTGSVIPGATVAVTNQGTGYSVTQVSGDSGGFVFPNMPPGQYRVRVELTGFRALEKTDLVLSADQILSLGRLALELGEITDEITIQAQGASVRVDQTGNQDVLTDDQLEGLMSQGRDIVSLTKVLPGVSQNASSDALGGNWGTGTPNMNGLRSHYNVFKLDGQSGSDIDVLNFFTMSVSMDAIGEVSVKKNAYLAELGQRPGVHVNIISKSGTDEFHGSAYWYKRHEQFNANDFFNNRQGISKPIGRIDTIGGVLGGPIFIPGKFNEDREKLFFFFSQENWRMNLPAGRFESTLPTSMERQGDFSQSFDQNGQLITVIDPMTGEPFPGNVIPQDRINPSGQGLLNFHPMPNFFDAAVTQGAFNYRALDSVEQPKRQTQLKIDFLPTPADRIMGRVRWWKSDRQAQVSSVAFSANYFKQRHHYNYPTSAYMGSWTRTISPNVVNEVSVGWDRRQELGDLSDEFGLENVRRADYVPNLGQLFPSVNPLGLMPSMSFGGLSFAPSSGFDPRTPIAADDRRWFLNENLSWVKGNHTFKFGLYWEMNDASEGPRASQPGQHMGAFNFGRNANNPFDSNHPFANALLGNFNSYAESSNRTEGIARTHTLEWYAQDSWRATQNLTLDYGVRFYSFTPWGLVDDEGSAFVVGQYDPNAVPLLFHPGFDDAGNRVAVDPRSGENFPVPLIGAFIPGTGDRLSGRVVHGSSAIPDGFRETPGIEVTPRFGFAYDVGGNGTTVLRGGFGTTKQAVSSSQASMWTTTTSPPLIETPQIFFGNIATFLEGGDQFFFPANASAFQREFPAPTIYNWSFGIQQDVGFGSVLDASYVGSAGRHLFQSRNLNTLPPGTRFLDSSQDPTTGSPLPDVFLRPFPGYGGSIGYLDNSGSSNYHALQASLNRRYAAGVQYGISYTWSKAMGLGGCSSDNCGVPTYRDIHTYLYGKLPFDQTHMLVFNYLWALPNADAFATNSLTRGIFHGWEMSGIVTLASGFPQGVGFSYTDGVDRWGGGDSPRTNIVGDPISSDKSFDRWFNTSAIAAPGFGDFGNAPVDVFRGPGMSNWDVTIYKRFPLAGERVRLRLGFEFYNILNHTQWENVNTGARFTPDGTQVNGLFGQVTSSRDPREMQFSLRVQF